jgi:hypothetical protein
MKMIDKETGDKISFVSFIIPEFASTYKMKYVRRLFLFKNMA